MRRALRSSVSTGLRVCRARSDTGAGTGAPDDVRRRKAPIMSLPMRARDESSARLLAVKSVGERLRGLRGMTVVVICREAGSSGAGLDARRLGDVGIN